MVHLETCPLHSPMWVTRLFLSVRNRSTDPPCLQFLIEMSQPRLFLPRPHQRLHQLPHRLWALLNRRLWLQLRHRRRHLHHYSQRHHHLQLQQTHQLRVLLLRQQLLPQLLRMLWLRQLQPVLHPWPRRLHLRVTLQAPRLRQKHQLDHRVLRQHKAVLQHLQLNQRHLQLACQPSLPLHRRALLLHHQLTCQQPHPPHLHLPMAPTWPRLHQVADPTAQQLALLLRL
mmetsp:Transcript_21298/g.30051  ORF Transcript_21298/g.30051 Transcript_21298/m.30051 type:complete len:228 (-) Transcript_21298:161-844(-)